MKIVLIWSDMTYIKSDVYAFDFQVLQVTVGSAKIHP